MYEYIVRYTYIVLKISAMYQFKLWTNKFFKHLTGFNIPVHGIIIYWRLTYWVRAWWCEVNLAEREADETMTKVASGSRRVSKLRRYNWQKLSACFNLVKECFKNRSRVGTLHGFRLRFPLLVFRYRVVKDLRRKITSEANYMYSKLLFLATLDVLELIDYLQLG